jgi:superfamily II DNA or RNA helicase
LLICDECHHITAMSYQKIINHFNSAKILGVTATPDRLDDVNLGSVFQTIAYQYPMVQAIKDKYLARFVKRQITDVVIDLRECKKTAGDLNEGDIQNAIEDQIGSMAISIKREIVDRKSVMAFLPGVESAAELSNELNKIDVSSASLNGKSSKEERKKIIEQFKRREIKVLCNCSLFLEGFDAPNCDCIVLARPTMSRSLYAQMVGRGLRWTEDKEYCLLLEFAYKTRHSLVTAYELFAASEFGADVRAIAEKMGDGDVLKQMEQAHEEKYNFEKVKKGIKQTYELKGFYDPFALCDLYKIDISGEFELKTDKGGNWSKYSIGANITPAQFNVLEKKKIDPSLLNRGQAAKVIDLVAQNKWNVKRIIDNAEQQYKNNLRK